MLFLIVGEKRSIRSYAFEQPKIPKIAIVKNKTKKKKAYLLSIFTPRILLNKNFNSTKLKHCTRFLFIPLNSNFAIRYKILPASRTESERNKTQVMLTNPNVIIQLSVECSCSKNCFLYL